MYGLGTSAYVVAGSFALEAWRCDSHRRFCWKTAGAFWFLIVV